MDAATFLLFFDEVVEDISKASCEAPRESPHEAPSHGDSGSYGDFGSSDSGSSYGGDSFGGGGDW